MEKLLPFVGVSCLGIFILVLAVGGIYLVYLGIKNIHLGPSLPAFLTPAVPIRLGNRFENQ